MDHSTSVTPPSHTGQRNSLSHPHSSHEVMSLRFSWEHPIPVCGNSTTLAVRVLHHPQYHMSSAPCPCPCPTDLSKPESRRLVKPKPPTNLVGGFEGWRRIRRSSENERRSEQDAPAVPSRRSSCAPGPHRSSRGTYPHPNDGPTVRSERKPCSLLLPWSVVRLPV